MSRSASGRSLRQRRRRRRAAGRRLTSGLGWSWIFFVNVRSVWPSLRQPVPAARERRRLGHRHFDFAGAASITAGLMLLVYAMTHAAQHGWGTTETIVLIALSVALIAASSRSRSARRRRCSRCESSATDALRLERRRALAGRVGLRAVLRPHPLHAAGPPLLSADDGLRLHRPRADDRLCAASPRPSPRASACTS